MSATENRRPSGERPEREEAETFDIEDDLGEETRVLPMPKNVAQSPETKPTTNTVHVDATQITPAKTTKPVNRLEPPTPKTAAAVAASIFEELERSNRRRELELATELGIPSSLAAAGMKPPNSGSAADFEDTDDVYSSAGGEDTEDDEPSSGPVPVGVGSSRARRPPAKAKKVVQATLPPRESLNVKSKTTKPGDSVVLSDIVNVRNVPRSAAQPPKSEGGPSSTSQSVPKKVVNAHEAKALPISDDESDFEIQFSDVEDDVGPEQRVASQKWNLPNAKRSHRTTDKVGGGHADRTRRVKFAVVQPTMTVGGGHARKPSDDDAFHLSDEEETKVEALELKPASADGRPPPAPKPATRPALSASTVPLKPALKNSANNNKMVVPKPVLSKNQNSTASLRATRHRNNSAQQDAAESPEPRKPESNTSRRADEETDLKETFKAHQVAFRDQQEDVDLPRDDDTTFPSPAAQPTSSRRDAAKRKSIMYAARDDDEEFDVLDDIDRAADAMFDPSDFVTGDQLDDSQKLSLRSNAMGPPSSTSTTDSNAGAVVQRYNNPRDKYRVGGVDPQQRPKSILRERSREKQKKQDAEGEEEMEKINDRAEEDDDKKEKSAEKKQYTWKEKMRKTELGMFIRQMSGFAIRMLLIVCVVFACAAAASFVYGIVRFSMPSDREKAANAFNDAYDDFYTVRRHRGSGRPSTTDADFITTLRPRIEFHDGLNPHSTNLTTASRRRITYKGMSDDLISDPHSVLLNCPVAGGFAVPCAKTNPSGDYAITIGTHRFDIDVPDHIEWRDNNYPRQALVNQSQFVDQKEMYGEWYLDTLCIVVKQEGGRLIRDPTLKSCWYPFTHHKYRRNPNGRGTFKFEVRLNTDPFLTWQQETRGTLEIHGTTKKERHIAGGWSLVIGFLGFIPFSYLAFRLALELFIRRGLRLKDKKLFERPVIVRSK